jgi:hypothetical protein
MERELDELEAWKPPPVRCSLEEHRAALAELDDFLSGQEHEGQPFWYNPATGRLCFRKY